MSKDWDCSYPREMAERKLGVYKGLLTLEELAYQMSLIHTEDKVSVRDVDTKPVIHSGVYLKGKLQGQSPYLSSRS